jgi:integration host factor subunit alpha
MNSLTRADIADEIQRKLGFSFSEANNTVDLLVDELCDGVVNDGNLKVTSFGTFTVREKKPRIGRNPKTKVEAVISGRKVVSFYCSSMLDEEINENK